MANSSLSVKDDAVSHDPDHRLPASKMEARQILEEIWGGLGQLDDDDILDLAKVEKKTRDRIHSIAHNLRKERAKFTRKYTKLTFKTP
jgi:hypothetical protein